MGNFFEQAMSLLGGHKSKSLQKDDTNDALYALRKKARYRFEFEASVSEEDDGEIVLRLQGVSDFLLVDVLRKAGVDLSQAIVTRSYSVIEDSHKKELRSIADIRTYSVFEDFPFVSSGESFDTNRESHSAVIYIGYNLHGQQSYTLVHLHPWGYRDTYATVMANISLYTEIGDDDFRLNRCLLVFDEDTSLRIHEEFAQCQRKAIQKADDGLPLWDWEKFSINADHQVNYYWESAESKMKYGRWSDALMLWSHVYDLYNQAAHEDSDQDLSDVLFHVSYQMGLCHYHRGQYETAKSYMDFSEYDNEENPEREACMQECYDRLSRTPSLMLMGHLLGNILQLVPEELSDLLCVDNETLESSIVCDLDDIWNFDLKSFMSQRSSATLYLSRNKMGSRPFERHPSETPGIHIEDRSIYFPNRSLIIHLLREEDVVQLSVLIPPGQLFDNNLQNAAEKVSLEFALFETCSTGLFNELRATAENKLQQEQDLEYHEFFALGRFPELRKDAIEGSMAFQEHRFGDALVCLTRAYHSLSQEWDRVELTSDEKCLYGELCYMLGYIYMEFGLYAHALFYLDALSESADPKWKIEYINALVNSKDIRAYSVVSKELEKAMRESDPKEKEYLNFLKRRYGYLLIEFNKQDEAKEYFQELLNNPDCKKFAREELDYLENSH